jgi:thiamine pyrophosphokinase
MKTVIFGNGDIEDYKNTERIIGGADLIICCDGGARHAKRLGIIPGLILGDFDSADESLLARYRSLGVAFEAYPAQKDQTDMELAITRAAEAGSGELLICGACGGRIDHELANIFLLEAAERAGMSASIATERGVISVVRGAAEFRRPAAETFISILPLTDSAVVSTRGLKYPLDRAVLKRDSSRGVSNEFSDDRAAVVVESGSALVITTNA